MKPLRWTWKEVAAGLALVCVTTTSMGVPAPLFQAFTNVAADEALKAPPSSFDVTPLGAAVWRMRFDLPRGRNGMAPPLGIAYNSKGGSGPLGLGFSITGLSAISRCWTTPAQDGIYRPDASAKAGVPDAFCLDGQRLVRRADGVRYALEFDPGVMIEDLGGSGDEPDQFVVHFADGRIARYGSRDDGSSASSNARVRGATLVVRVKHPRSPTELIDSDLMDEGFSGAARTLAWNIDRLEDRYQNHIEFDYLRSSGPPTSDGVEVVISQVRWTGNAGSTRLPALRSATFEYGTRQDVRTGFNAGVRIMTSRMLKRVVVKAPSGLTSAATAPEEVREYGFDYFPLEPNSRVVDRLASIVECVPNADDSIPLRCRDPISFTWSGMQTPLVPKFSPAALDCGPADDKDSPQLLGPNENQALAVEVFDAAVGDVDGDGRDDVLYRVYQAKDDTEPGALFIGTWRLRLGTADGLGCPIDVSELPRSLGGDFKFSLRLVDLESNGRADAVIYSEPLPPVGTLGWAGYSVYRFDVMSKKFVFVPEASEATSMPNVPGYPRRSISVSLGDLDGDGRVDSVRDANADGTPLPDYYRPGDPVVPALRHGVHAGPLGFSDASVLRLPAGDPISGGYGEDRFVVDVDGSGQPVLLMPVYNMGAQVGARPVTYSMITAPLTATEVSRVSLTKLSALPAEFSDAIADMTGQTCDRRGVTRYSRWFLDLDGDGLPDSIAIPSDVRDRCAYTRQLGKAFFVSQNAGTDFRPLKRATPNGGAAFAAPNTTMQGERAVDPGVRIVDLDRDGRQDLLLVSRSTGGDTTQTGVGRGPEGPHRNMVWLRSNGSSYADPFTAHELNVPIALSGYYDDAHTKVQPGYGPRMTQIADVNGDGLADIVTWVYYADGHGALRLRMGVYLQDSAEPDVVTQVDGGPHVPYLKIAYKLGTAQRAGSPYTTTRDATCAWPMFCQKSIGWVVAEHREEASYDGSLQERIYRYRYEDGVADVLGRRGLGVKRHVRTTLDEAGKVYGTSTLEFDLTRRVNRPVPDGLPPDLQLYAYSQVGGPVKTTAVSYLGATQQRPAYTHTRVTDNDSALEVIIPKPDTPPGCKVPAGYRRGAAISVDSEFEDSTLLSATRTTRTFDCYGNAIEDLIEKSDTALDLRSPAAGRWLSTRVQKSDNDVSEDHWLVARFKKITTTLSDPSLPTQSTVVRSTQVSYQPNTLDVLSITRMEDAAAETATTSAMTRTRTFERDALTGNLISVSDAAPPKADGSGALVRSSRVSFDVGDSELVFPAIVENALGHQVHIFPHAGLGLPMAIDDANGVRTLYTYDKLGRIRTESRTASLTGHRATSTQTYKSEGSITNRGRNVIVCSTSDIAGTSCAMSDPAGVTVETSWARLHGTSGLNYRHDRFGRITAQSLPSVSSLPSAFIEYLRDELGRVTAVSRPGPTRRAPRQVSTIGYAGQQIIHTSERGITTTSTFDFAGRLAARKVQDPLDPAHRVGSGYAYWHGSSIRKVTHPQLRTGATPLETTVEYDDLGRRRSLVDSDLGSQTVLYDGWDRVKESKDGTGSATTHAYDKLDRINLLETLATPDYPARSGWAYAQRDVFEYDGQNGLGLPSLLTANAPIPGGLQRDDTVVKRYSYDPLGRLATSTTQIGNGIAYDFSLTYNDLGQLAVLNYPPQAAGPFAVRFMYADNGQVETIANATNPAGDTLLWQLLDQNAAGQSTAEQFGQTASTTRVYDDAFQLRWITTTLAPRSESVQKLWHGWGADGFITQRKDFDLVLDESFSHDFLGRLVDWDVVQNCVAWDWRFTYDDRGNLTERAIGRDGGTPVTSMKLEYLGPAAHAASTVTEGAAAANGLQYDGAGQLRSGRGNAFTWTPLGLPLSVTSNGPGAPTASYLYDANGRRTLETRAPLADTTLNINGLLEIRSTVASRAVTYNVPIGAALAQTVRIAGEAEQTWFIHPDHLGNPDAVTQESRLTDGTVASTLLARGKFDPYGERRFPWAVAQPTRSPVPIGSSYGFTGHEPDEPFGLINMGGRIFDPHIGRFASPDPYVATLSSESLNRFSYVQNSPLMRVDPTGLADEDDPCFVKEGCQTFARKPPPQAPAVPPPKKFDASGVYDNAAVRIARDDASQFFRKPVMDESTPSAVVAAGPSTAPNPGTIGSAPPLSFWEDAFDALTFSATVEKVAPGGGPAGWIYSAIKDLKDAALTVKAWTRDERDVSTLELLSAGFTIGSAILVPEGSELLPSGKLVGATAKEATTVIGRVKDLQKLGPGEKSLLDLLPNLGNPKANWTQNSGVLRQEMGRGLPIRDASVGDNAGQFLNAERHLLQERGWTFDSVTKFWNSPK